jgi:formate C-acetyltransferase
MLHETLPEPYEYCRDGISLTVSVVPASLGKESDTKVNNLSSIIDGYFMTGGHHLNINVLDKETLLKAMKDPMNYSQLTVRVSGYAVNFIKLNRCQQEEVISRTFHSVM